MGNKPKLSKDEIEMNTQCLSLLEANGAHDARSRNVIEERP